jgi:periplasmic protein TonB
MKTLVYNRFLLSLVFSVTVSVGLFLLMQHLIRGDDVELSEPPTPRPLDWVRLAPEEAPPKRRERERPTPPEPPPEVAVTNHYNHQGTSHQHNVAPPDTSEQITPVSSQGDMEVSTLFTVAASYPERALSRHVEGHVLLRFTVNAHGNVEDVQVLEAEPSGYFESAAIDALSRTRFRPRVVGGHPVPAEGVVHRVVFTLDSARR